MNAGEESPRLFGRSSLDNPQIVLSDDDRQWLWAQRTLRLGVSQPDYPPFDITGTGREYEGISADYSGLVAQLLNLRIEVQRYGSRLEAIAALKAGEIDLLGTSSGLEAATHELALSDSYAEDRPLLVTRGDDDGALDPGLPGKRLAMLENYRLASTVHRLYPNAELVTFASTLSALGAVAFGQADLYLGNALGAHYLASKSHLDNVRLAQFAPLPMNHFGFAVASHNRQLLALVNAALQAIPAHEGKNILRRWSVGGVSIPVRQRLQLSAAEQRWLERNPRVRVVIDDAFLPVSYRDSQGRFRGISADVLAKVALKTGLSFDVINGGSIEQMIQQVRRGEADVLAALPPSQERREQLSFTRAYLSNSLVLVTADAPGSPVSLEQLAGKTLVLIHGSYLSDFLRERYPHIKVIYARNSSNALAKVAKGKASAAVVSLIGGRYMISRQYRGRLRIGAPLPVQPANFAFATDRGAHELLSILNKALLSIVPQEMDELTNRWRSEVIIADSYWQTWRWLILQGFAIAGLLLLVALFWIRALRRLVRARERTQRALTDQLEFMRVMIDGTPHPIYVRDCDGLLQTCNLSYLQALGVTRETVIGQPVPVEVLGEEQAQAYHQAYMSVMAEGKPVIEDRLLTLANGKQLTLYHWMLPYRGSDGAVAGLIAGWIDISERQRLYDALQIAKDDAEAANRAKTTFLATMSHEIRTPMNALLGMLELALRKAEQGVLDRMAIEVASGAARSLLELVGDILDITRIESGHLALAPQRAFLRKEVGSTVRMFEGQARHKHLHLILDAGDGADIGVMLDPLRFKQILSNLISNAIKFTHEGEVRVRLGFDLQGEHVAVHLTVEDTGVGIPPADLSSLGSPFRQASNNQQSARSGTGLGLSISRTLCAMMGGQMTLNSTLGAGTVVEVRLHLPQAQPEEPAGPQSPLEPRRAALPLNILVVDDYPANRLLLHQQLSYLGHRVTLAKDGHEGLRGWLREHFDVVITDCNMPGLDGYALARCIREDERRKRKPACLLLGSTANAQVDERRRCLQAGMDDCLFKPLELGDLAERLHRVTPAKGSKAVLEAQVMGDGFDLSSLRQLTGGDVASVKVLLRDLQKSNHEDLQRLELLQRETDLGGLADLVHRVKGGARIIKARHLLHACEQLENACARSSTVDQIDPSVDALRQAMESLGGSLEQFCQG
ncbi:transporter substrate-binding domain-containing protein [Pseudomonas sp. LS1212]|uniref:transporter substrate-binding domain-containing protein n=1 Tax=Pseudomonas sp. LS1212 TaxID=2972478 RepID=UPI00215D00A7|nr:transporter substrate-binding domain-containing protein [Pseudomonas sp. LS1212]UVJ46062.1 transporter substrate-binding domain-containing protein [Pseudomonas sp. LS1212]